jgi:hypothetical protein
MHLDSEGSHAATQPGRIGTPALLAVAVAGALLAGLAAVVALTSRNAKRS